jgi:hypothetical protein
MRFEGKIKLFGNIEQLKKVKDLISLEANIRHNDKKFPGIWLQWKLIEEENNFFLVWDNNEKFYNSFEWLVWIIDSFFTPNKIIANGTIYLFDHYAYSTGVINVSDNVAKFISLEELAYEFFN